MGKCRRSCSSKCMLPSKRPRSGAPAKRTLAALGISRGSYYRWLKEEAWAKEKSEIRPVQAFEALAEERAAVLAYARRHPYRQTRDRRSNPVELGLPGT